MGLKYLVYDTNCMINAFNHRNNMLDYEEIRSKTVLEGIKRVITPYTLYELLQRLSRFEDIDLLRNQLIEFGDFYVINYNRILEHDFLEYGIDYIFLLCFDKPENNREFGEKRDNLRAKIYESLVAKIIIIAELISILYLIYEDYSSLGSIKEETYFKIHYIDERFYIQHGSRYRQLYREIYKHAGLPSYDPYTKEFYHDHDAGTRENTREVIIELVREILAVSDVELTLSNSEWTYNLNEYNQRIIERVTQYMTTITMESFAKRYRKCLAKLGNTVSINNLYETLMVKEADSITKEFYLQIMKRVFEQRGLGDINNDLLDISIIQSLKCFKPNTVAFITEDKKWKDYMLNSKNPIFDQTKDFYEKFWKGTE